MCAYNETMAKKNYKWMDEDLKFVRKMGGYSKKSPQLKDRTKRFVKQYKERGWCDADCWCLDQKFAQWMAPRLKVFIEQSKCYPHGHTPESWTALLKEMLVGFEFVASDEYYSSYDKKLHRAARKSFVLFGKWAQAIWW